MDERITELESEDSYVLASGSTNVDAITRLGVVEDMIESGEIMNPDYGQGDTVYFIYKQQVVLEGVIESVFSEYDAASAKYLYRMLVRNSFYEVVADIPAAGYGTVWFGNEQAASTALAALSQG